MNHNNYQHGIITPRAQRVQQWHTYFDGNQQLFNWTYHPFDKREIMPGSVNPANYTGLVSELTDLEEEPTNITSLNPHYV